jgi:STE24 endopeptidase
MRIGKDRFRRHCSNLGLMLVLSSAILSPAQAPTGSQKTPASVVAPQPSAAPYHLPPAKLAQAKTLGKIRPLIYFGSEVWEIAVFWLLLATGSATRLADWVTAKAPRRWLDTWIFSAILIAILFLVIDIPMGVVGHAVSLHFGISIYGWLAWLVDQPKTLFLAVLFGAPTLMLYFFLMRWNWSRKLYWFWFASTAVPIMILTTFLMPTVIEPIFSDFEPLAHSHPALVQQLERVVARTGTSIPPERMFLMNVSKRTNGLNAYVTGLGASKRIVVWDTTADRMPADEILFTFAHETGHYVLNHILKGLALASIELFALFWVAVNLAEWLVRRFGQRWRIDKVASLPGMVVLMFAMLLTQIVTEPLDNFVSRQIEHEADVYGQEAIHGLVADPRKSAVAAFNHLGEAYLDEPTPNAFVEFWTDNHPSTQSRATFASHYNPWAPGQRPRFFAK